MTSPRSFAADMRFKVPASMRPARGSQFEWYPVKHWLWLGPKSKKKRANTEGLSLKPLDFIFLGEGARGGVATEAVH